MSAISAKNSKTEGNGNRKDSGSLKAGGLAGEDHTPNEKDLKAGKKGSNGLVIGREDDTTEDEEDDEDEELLDLPPELKDLSNQTFGSQADLDFEVVKRGFPDLLVVLNSEGKPRLKMTTGAHNSVINEYIKDFDLAWGKNRWATALPLSNVFVKPAGKMYRRQPDIAFWGYKKCRYIRNAMHPKNVPTPPKIFKVTREQYENFHPDVVFQFSWGNKEPREVAAMDDLMNHVVPVPPQPENSCPRLGFLVKMRTLGTNKRTRDDRKIITGLDVYRIPHGATFNDAVNNQNGASHFYYAPGQPDVILKITAEDLGIEGFWAWFCAEPYKISAKEIFDKLSNE